MTERSLPDVDYEDGLGVWLILAIVWLLFSFEAALIVGLAWLIAGMSKRNALLEAELTEHKD